MKKVKYVRCVLVLLLCFLLVSCATILSGTTSTVNLQTSDGGRVKAKVSSKTGVQDVILPSVVMVKNSSSPIQIFTDDNCYFPITYAVKSDFNPVTLFNIAIGGLLGTTTDSVSGAMWKYDETAIVPVQKKADCGVQNSGSKSLPERGSFSTKN